jgi:acyl dehydratase
MANPLKAGDRLYTGAVISAAEAAAYNRATARIESFEREGRPVPEQLLNGRHNLFAAMAAIRT